MFFTSQSILNLSLLFNHLKNVLAYLAAEIDHSNIKPIRLGRTSTVISPRPIKVVRGIESDIHRVTLVCCLVDTRSTRLVQNN